MKRSKSLFVGIVILLLAAIFSTWGEKVYSQSKYPTKPIDIIVPFKPAGGTDSVIRVIAPFLKKKWGVPINVVNKPGGNTLPGSVEVFDSSPNGYTLLADCNASSSMLGVVIKNIPFSIMDKTFLGITANGPLALMVTAKSSYKTIEDVKSEARRDPDNFTWVSLGGVSGPDFITRQFFKAIGVDVLKTKPVMGTGGTDVQTLVAGGNVKLGGTNIISANAAIQAGLIRVLGIARVKDPDFPNIPTFEELGYPGINHVWWVGFSGPPKIPSYIVDAWNKALKEITEDPEYVSRLKGIGFYPFYNNSGDMKEYIRKETEEVADLYGMKKK
jgi:tripartite-type tricarboxylate transporter receptor subunit TctC